MNKPINDIVDYIKNIEKIKNKKPSLLQKFLNKTGVGKIPPFLMLAPLPLFIMFWGFFSLSFANNHNLSDGAMEVMAGLGTLGVVIVSFSLFYILDKYKIEKKNSTSSINAMARIKDIFEKENVDREVFKVLIENRDALTSSWWKTLHMKIDKYAINSRELEIKKANEDRNEKLLKHLTEFGAGNQQIKEDEMQDLKINIKHEKLVRKRGDA